MADDERLRGLDGVPWGDLVDCHGQDGTGVRDDLAAALAGDPAEAAGAVEDLCVSLADRGYGYRLPSAVPAALPFLARAAADAVRPRQVRLDALDLVGDVCSGWDLPAPATVREALLPLLADPCPEVRVKAAEALARGRGGDAAVVEALRERHGAETDPGVRLRLLAAAVRLTGRGGPVPGWLRDRFENGDRDERVLVGSGAFGDPVPTARAAMDDLVREPCPRWFRAAGLGADGRDDRRFRYAQVWIHRALDRDGRERVARDLLGHADARVRAAAVRAALDLVGEFRSAAGPWAGRVAPLLDDPDPEVRRWAVRSLSAVGDRARPWSDRLAGIAAEPGDDAAQALLALARLGDPRAPALLLARSGLPLFGFDPVPSRDPWGWDPTFEEAMEAFAPWADELLPHLRERMGGDPWEARWAAPALAAWGPRAAPLADTVAGLLGGGDRDPGLVAVLAAIGPAAARHADRVRESAAGPGRAHAYLRLTGDTGAALDLLGPFGARWHDREWALLAEAGPAAARYEADLREYTDLRGAHDARALHALWRVTGDTRAVLAALLDTDHPYLGERVLTGTGTAAVRLLGGIGPPAGRALPRLRALLGSDRTAHVSPRALSRRGIAQDRDLTALLRDAVARIGGRG
ncbi:hypothetical protein HUT17_01315 [Nocardiopsis flavescens]|nr:hypothetical protein HUT17_01315 [Nocardiopsis flavescens]